MAKEDYRKSSLEVVTGIYENVKNWLEVLGENISEEDMMVKAKDGSSASIESNIGFLYKFAKLGAMSNVTGITEELEEHEKAMLQEEES